MMKNIKITQRDSISIRKYLLELHNQTPLSLEAEYNYALMAKSGNTMAQAKLVEANLRLVVSIAKEYTSTKNKLEDLIAAGNIGLVIASRRFEPNKGFKFITFAVWYIRKYILEFINENEPIWVPINKIKTHKRTPVISIYQPIDEDIIVLDTIKNNNSVAPDAHIDDFNIKITQLLSKLKDKEKEVIEMLYGLYGTVPHSKTEIAKKIGATHQRVCQIIQIAMSKLKENENKEYYDK